MKNNYECYAICKNAIISLDLLLTLPKQFFEEVRDQAGNFVSIKKTKDSMRVKIEVNDPVRIPIDSSVASTG